MDRGGTGIEASTRKERVGLVVDHDVARSEEAGRWIQVGEWSGRGHFGHGDNVRVE